MILKNPQKTKLPLAEVLPDNFHHPNISMGQRAIQKSFDGTFLEGEIVAIDGGEQVFVWDLRATGRALTMVAFLVGTLLFLLINFVFSRSRS